MSLRARAKQSQGIVTPAVGRLAVTEKRIVLKNLDYYKKK